MKKTKVSTNQPAAQSVKTDRRAFLRSGLAATGGLAASVAMTGTAQADEEEVIEVAPKDEGYQLTDHVSLYYKSAEV